MVTRLKKGGKVKHSSFRAAMQSPSNSLEVFFELFCSRLHGYRIKLHEQLVLVSSTPHSACTSNLSTSWSRTTLQGGQASGKTNLQASFPLRCFQRLSLPNVANQPRHWRDDWHTSGVIWHPLAGIWHIGPHPQKANGPWNYSKGHLRLIAPEHYSSKINLRMRRPPFEAEGALRCVEC